jgi:hypothetical protein
MANWKTGNCSLDLLFAPFFVEERNRLFPTQPEAAKCFFAGRNYTRLEYSISTAGQRRQEFQLIVHPINSRRKVCDRD